MTFWQAVYNWDSNFDVHISSKTEHAYGVERWRKYHWEKLPLSEEDKGCQLDADSLRIDFYPKKQY